MKPFLTVAEIDHYALHFGRGPFVAFCRSVPVFFYRHAGVTKWTWVFFGYMDSEDWTNQMLREHEFSPFEAGGL